MLNSRLSLKKTAMLLIGTIFSVSSFCTHADTCRSGSAASEGSKIGFQREADAANAQANSNKTSSDTIGKCVSGITSIKVTVPTFPSLDDIYKEVEDKVCQAASDAISGVTGDIDGQIDKIMDEINGDIDIYTDPSHYGSSTRSVQSTSNSTVNLNSEPQPALKSDDTIVSSDALSNAYQ